MACAAGPPEPGRAPDRYAETARTLAWAEPVQNLMLRGARADVVRLLRVQGCRRVLDLCCGTGRLVHLLAREGMEAEGVDSSPAMLALARRKRRLGEFRELDATALPEAAAYDAATVCLALHEMAPAARGAIWRRMRAAVRTGGLLVAMDFDPPGPGWLSRFVARRIAGDERGFQRSDPAHYEHFLEFMAGGGLSGWLAAQGAVPEVERRHLSGNLLVAAVRTRSAPA